MEQDASRQGGMQLHPDLEARRRGAAGAGRSTGRESEVPRGDPAREDAPGGEMPGGSVPGAGEDDGEMPRGTMTGGDSPGGEMPRGDMHDAGAAGIGAINRVAELLGGMPFGPATAGDPGGGMPSGAMGGSDPSGPSGFGAVESPGHVTGAATGEMPAGEMPAGGMNGQTGPTRGAPAPAAAASGQDAGLTIQGEWRLTLSSISIGRGR